MWVLMDIGTLRILAIASKYFAPVMISGLAQLYIFPKVGDLPDAARTTLANVLMFVKRFLEITF